MANKTKRNRKALEHFRENPVDAFSEIGLIFFIAQNTDFPQRRFQILLEITDNECENGEPGRSDISTALGSVGGCFGTL